MSGETELDKLLSLMQPRLIEGEYVFCSLSDCKYGDLAEL
ncbi:MAG: ACT domain-containing protein, partial [Pseudomonadota bacterium]|nr:ACT domain-containing protein [Pseudomonadota bacterium]